jgi:hypothetical protein
MIASLIFCGQGETDVLAAPETLELASAGESTRAE